jgi:hypothetical protein
MATSTDKTFVVTVSSPEGDRSFTVKGLSDEEVRQLLYRASDGKFFKVVEQDSAPAQHKVVAQNKAINHLADATGVLAFVMIGTAMVVRRLQRWLQD